MDIVVGVAGDGEDFERNQVALQVPAPPLTGDRLLYGYEVANSVERQALDAWAQTHILPGVKHLASANGAVDTLVLEAKEEPMLVGCEFYFEKDGSVVG